MVNDYERYRTRLARREVLRRIDAHTDVLLDGVEEAAMRRRTRLVWFDMRRVGHDLVIEAPLGTDPAALRIAAAVRLLPFGWRFVRDAEVREDPDIEVVEVEGGPHGQA